MSIISIYEDSGRRKVIGKVEGGLFTKFDAPKGQRVYRRLNSIAIDAKTWYNTFDKGLKISSVKAKDDNDNLLEISSVEIQSLMVKKDAVFRHHKPHRAQIFIPLRFWHSIKSTTTNRLNGEPGRDEESLGRKASIQRLKETISHYQGLLNKLKKEGKECINYR